jgi:hypothetical protein
MEIYYFVVVLQQYVSGLDISEAAVLLFRYKEGSP